MARRILVPLDGTPEAESILSEVQRILSPLAQVHLLHLMPMVAQPVGQSPLAGFALEEEARAYLENARLRWIPGRDGLDLVRSGDPSSGILNLALEMNIDLIAMTTHGRSGLARVILGSVAEAVVRNAQLPVLLTRPLPRIPTSGIRRILVAVDSGEVPPLLLDTVKSLASPSSAEIVLFHAADPLSSPAAPQHRLQEAADALEEQGWVAWPVVASGEPVEAILGQIRPLEVDLIAMATHGRSGLERILGGSVAERILRDSPVAVLLQKPVVVHKSAMVGERHD